MFAWIEVILLGICEGITEWLPVSSTGHMLLLYELFHINESDPFWSMFLVVIQLGAILAVILLYFPRLWPFQRPDQGAKGMAKVKSVFREEKVLMWAKILVSLVPAVIVGLLLDDWIEARFYNYVTVAVMLIVYGVLFIVVERWNSGRAPKVKKIADVSFSLALWIGVFQMLAVIPGTSRSGATILGGLILGMSRKCAAEYTFFLAIPTMLGASLLKIVKFGGSFTGAQIFYLILGMAVAFVVSVVAIRMLMSYIRKHDFHIFGIYRIVLGILVLLVFSIRGMMAA